MAVNCLSLPMINNICQKEEEKEKEKEKGKKEASQEKCAFYIYKILPVKYRIVRAVALSSIDSISDK